MAMKSVVGKLICLAVKKTKVTNIYLKKMLFNTLSDSICG